VPFSTSVSPYVIEQKIEVQGLGRHAGGVLTHDGGFGRSPTFLKT
jgi:hypothetical protein